MRTNIYTRLMKYTCTLEHSLSSGMSLDINRHLFQLIYQRILDLKSRNQITSSDPKCRCHVIKGFTAYVLMTTCSDIYIYIYSKEVSLDQRYIVEKCSLIRDI